MKGIIGVNFAGYIGLDGGIPWDCPDDLKYFKELTMGCTLLTGYNTSLKLPKLKGRTLIVDPREMLDDETIKTIDWCIGGKKTYEKYMHKFTDLYVSIIDDYTIGDVIEPDWSHLNNSCQIKIKRFSVRS